MGRQTYYYNNNQKALTGEQVAALAYKAGFRGEDLAKAVAIAKRESGWKPNIHGTDSAPEKVSGDRGLFQINRVNDKTLVAAGLLSREGDPKIFDPLTNAKAAYLLYQRAGNNFAPAWSVGPGGWNGTGDPLYGTNLPAAKEAVTNAAKGGLFGSGIDLGDLLGPGWNLIPGVPDIPNPVGGLLDLAGIGGIKDAASASVALVRALLNTQTWIRVAQVLGGGFLIIVGLIVMIGPEAGKVAMSAMPVGKAAGAAQAAQAVA